MDLKSEHFAGLSYLVLVHAVDRESDKVDARKFLASFGTRCRQSQKKHLIQSALLWFKDRTAEQAVERFCEIRNVDTLIIASNGSPTWTDKIKGRASDHCVNYVHSADVIIWKDPNPNPLPQLDLPNWTYVTDQFPKDRNPGSRRHSVDGVVFRNAESRRSSLKQSEADDSQQEIKISRRHSVDNGELAHQVPSPPKEPRPTPVEKKNTPLSYQRSLDKEKKSKKKNSTTNETEEGNTKIKNSKYKNYNDVSLDTDFIRGDLFCDNF